MKEPAVSAEPRREGKAVRGTETIILAEDEEQVRLPISRILRDNGYTVVSVADGEEAAGLGEERIKQASLLLTDLIMPRLGGKELAERLTRISSGLKVIFMTGYFGELDGIRTKPAEKYGFIQKPVDLAVLLDKVRSMLDAPQI